MFLRHWSPSYFLVSLQSSCSVSWKVPGSVSDPGNICYTQSVFSRVTTWLKQRGNISYMCLSHLEVPHSTELSPDLDLSPFCYSPYQILPGPYGVCEIPGTAVLLINLDALSMTLGGSCWSQLHCKDDEVTGWWGGIPCLPDPQVCDLCQGSPNIPLIRITREALAHWLPRPPVVNAACLGLPLSTLALGYIGGKNNDNKDFLVL